MIASDSNATEVTLDDLYDLLKNYSDDSSDSDVVSGLSTYDTGSPMEYSEMDLFGSEYVESSIAYNPVQMADISTWDYINCLRLDCTISGDDVTVLFPLPR